MTKKSQQDGYVFKGQRSDEEFLFMFRRHIIAMRKGFYLFLGIFALACLPTFAFLMVNESMLETGLYIAMGGFGLGLMAFLYHFMNWHFSIYIVSDHRIRQIVQKGFFAREVMDMPLSKIQSINYNVSGLFGELFKFGTINILTIVGDMEIKNVEHPDEIYNKLQDAIANVEQEEDEEY